jgi:hypothetical protein
MASLIGVSVAGFTHSGALQNCTKAIAGSSSAFSTLSVSLAYSHTVLLELIVFGASTEVRLWYQCGHARFLHINKQAFGKAVASVNQGH